MFTVSGQTIKYDHAWTHPDTGEQYPANWLRKSSPADKQAAGLVEVTTSPEAVYDRRFYWSASNPKQLDDEPAVDEDGNELGYTQTGLKTQWKKTQSEIATSLLNESDKRVIKALDEATSFAEFKAAKPANYTTYRAAVRTACNTRQTEIDACADVAALKELLFGASQIEQDGEMVANPNLATAWPDPID